MSRAQRVVARRNREAAIASFGGSHVAEVVTTEISEPVISRGTVYFGAAGFSFWQCVCGRRGPRYLRESAARKGAAVHVAMMTRRRVAPKQSTRCQSIGSGGLQCQREAGHEGPHGAWEL